MPSTTCLPRLPRTQGRTAVRRTAVCAGNVQLGRSIKEALVGNQVELGYGFDHHRIYMSVVARNRKSSALQCVADRLAEDGCNVVNLSYHELLSRWMHEQVTNSHTAVGESLSLRAIRNELKGNAADVIAKPKPKDDDLFYGHDLCNCSPSGMLSTSLWCGSRVVLGRMVSTPEVKSIVRCDVDSEEEHDQPAVKNRVERRGDVDLAAPDVSFDCLVSMGQILALLLEICIYSRMTPGGNVQCVKPHTEPVAAAYSCSDGGNDGGSDFRARRCRSD
ncbi:hypothetical protein GQ600_25052 [Phytophthora cactorum]|nr:hypothetical protein GQ600_25052 [Phytophthora cactorum]